MEVSIKFAPSGGYDIDVDYGMEQGLKVISTYDKYVLINYTIDGDFVEVYDDFEQLLKKIEEYYGDDIKQDLLDAFKENGAKEVKIDFADPSPEVDYGMEQGLKVIEADKFVLIHYTIDGDYVEIYDDFEELLKKIEKYYGNDVKQLLLNAFKKYYGDETVKEMLNNG